MLVSISREAHLHHLLLGFARDVEQAIQSLVIDHEIPLGLLSLLSCKDRGEGGGEVE